MRPDALYVVHTRALTERRAALTAQLDRLGWEAEWIIDRDRDHHRAGRVLMQWLSRLSRGEIDVYLKHLAVLRRVAAADGGAALVLEDDAIWRDGFGERFERYLRAAPPDFDLIFFGASCGMEVEGLAEHPLFGLGYGTRSMSGYLVTRECARALVAELARRPLSAPIDLTVNDIVRVCSLRAYWSVPAIIENGSETQRFARSITAGRLRAFRRLTAPADPARRANQRLHPPRGHARRYILSMLREELTAVARDHLPAGGVLLDVGAGTAPYRSIFEPHVSRYVAVDRLPPTFPAESADVILSTQVLEHVADSHAFLRDCFRVLKPGGLLIVSTHGHWMHHPDPADYWRWTRSGLEKLVAETGFRVMCVRGVMGLAATGLQLFQDGLAAKLPGVCRWPFFLVMQTAIAAADRVHSQTDRDRDACVFVVVAIKPA